MRERALRLCWLLLMGIPLLAGGPSFAEGLVKDERGFEGAVTVVSEETSGAFAVVKVKVPYLDIRGEHREGLARLVVPRAAASGRPLPAFCHVHYEKDVKGAKEWARKGWAVFSAVYTGAQEGYPIDAAVANGYNEARAILQWVRRLPFIDPARLHVDGGSQGGYMALAMSADAFPVTSTTADCPVVNWSYNLQYFEANKGASKYPAQAKDSPLPIMCSVTGLAEQCYKAFGSDLASDTWYELSPISFLDRITDPVMVMCATGDMLVPMEQMVRQPLHPVDSGRFPEGYQRAFAPLTPCGKARTVFEDLIPETARETFVLPLQKDSFEVTLEMFQDPAKKPSKRPKNQERPWSKEKQWSLVYLDEGPPTPYASHTSYEWSVSPDTFVAAHQQGGLGAPLLNAPKLEWLMRRYARSLNHVPTLAEGKAANRLNFEIVERRDVLTGLIAYAASDPDCAARLEELYKVCPVQPFGASVTLERLRRALEKP